MTKQHEDSTTLRQKESLRKGVRRTVAALAIIVGVIFLLSIWQIALKQQ